MSRSDGSRPDLDRVLRETLGAPRQPPSRGSAEAPRVEDVLRRGRRRQERRRAALVVACAAVIAAAGTAALRAGSSSTHQRVGVADPASPAAGSRPPAAPASSSQEPTDTQPGSTQAHPGSTETQPTSSPVASGPSSSGGSGPTLTTAPPSLAGPIDAIVVKGATMELRAGSMMLDRFEPCAGIAPPCDVPVVAADGPTVAYLRRSGTGRDVLLRSGGLDTLVRVETGSKAIVDLAVGAQLEGGRVLYVVAADDPATGTGQLIQHTPSDVGPAVDHVLADGVHEVVATADGRIAWTTDDALVIQSPSGEHTIPLPIGGGRPTQLSFAPEGSTLLARDGADPSRRLVIGPSLTNGAPLARVVEAADAGCWQSNTSIVVFDRRTASLRRVDPATGASAANGELAMPAFVTDQIACQADGSVLLVDRSVEQGSARGSGDLLSRAPDGTVSRTPGPFDRVRSVR